MTILPLYWESARDFHDFGADLTAFVLYAITVGITRVPV